MKKKKPWKSKKGANNHFFLYFVVYWLHNGRCFSPLEAERCPLTALPSYFVHFISISISNVYLSRHWVNLEKHFLSATSEKLVENHSRAQIQLPFNKTLSNLSNVNCQVPSSNGKEKTTDTGSHRRKGSLL